MEKYFKLKVYINDGSYFWAKVYKEDVEAIFNETVYNLIECNGRLFKFESSTEDVLEFEISEKSYNDIVYVQQNKL